MSAFPKFQINLDYDAGMFTLRAETWDEFVENLTVAGGQDTAEAILGKIKIGLENLVDTPARPRPGSAAQDTLAAGGVSTTRLEDKLCPGHRVAMTLKEAKTGARKGNKFWSCNGKNAAGDWAWRSGEGCKPEDYNEQTDAGFNTNAR